MRISCYEDFVMGSEICLCAKFKLQKLVMIIYVFYCCAYAEANLRHE